jgi:tetratricopeptide (TPR) repeat protein
MERYQDTLAELNRAIEQNPDDTRAIAQRGETYRQMAHVEAALADFDRAIELNPNYAWAIAHRGETYYQMKRYEEALDDFNRAIELNPDYIWAIAHRGATYEYMGRYEEALTDLNRAIELKPDYAWAFAHRSRNYQEMKCYEESLADFDRAIALDKTIVKERLMERGLLLHLMGRYPEAIEYYEQALQENPDDYFSMYGIVNAKTYWKGLSETQAQINELRAVLQSVVKSSAHSFALYGLSGLAALEGKTDEALNYLQEAISLDNCRADMARHDRVWFDLRSDPRFQALTALDIGCVSR